MFFQKSGVVLMLTSSNVFFGESANDVWDQAYTRIRDSKLTEISRVGKTRYINQAVFYITNPRKRIVVNREPVFSIAFSVAEIIWILAGSNKSSVINLFNPSLPKFAGNTDTYYGAYGFRLINSTVNQIKLAYETLRDNPNSRQVVLNIWNPELDLPNENGKPRSADIPCNLMSILKVSHGKLFWTQIMRSNDLILGTPYNFMQFTTLHELFANWLNLELGDYVLVCNNLHIYEKKLSRYQNLQSPTHEIKIDLTDYNETMKNVNRLYARMQILDDLDTIESSDLDNFCKIDLGSIFLNDCKWLMTSYLYKRIGTKEDVAEHLNKVKSIGLKNEMLRWYKCQDKSGSYSNRFIFGQKKFPFQ